MSVRVAGMHSAPSKCKMLSDWISPKPNIVPSGKELYGVDISSHLNTCSLVGVLISDKPNSHLRNAFMIPRHLRRRPDIRLLLRGRVCILAVTPVLLNGSQTRSLRADVPGMFENRYPRDIFRMR